VGFRGATMGTTFAVRLGAQMDDEALAALEADTRAVLQAVDSRMSTYDPASELSRFNHGRETGWQILSPDTTAVIERALSVSRSSAGAFDATVGPLVNLWGFGPDGEPGGAPGEREVAAARERVGWWQVEVDGRAHAVRKRRADSYLDLSGIAKGYGVDAVAGLLDSRGIGDFLVEVGGELATRGARPGGDAWRVAIEQPVPGVRRVQRLVDLRGRAIATSGNYRNYFDEAGRHYCHAIDPRDGHPVVHALASISVIADSAIDADAVSTALMVMGPEAGSEWAREHGVAALFLIRDGASLRERATPSFDAHLVG
jgi:thiamine biosynthesis lipoprotein